LTSRRYGVHSVLLTDTAREALGDALQARPGLPVYLAPLPVLKAVVGFDFHRGCLALGVREGGPSVDEVVARAARRRVLLEDLSNPDNMGGVLRAARGLGADGALLSPACGDPLYRKAIRVSMGAALELPWARVPDWDTALSRVRNAGFTLVALDPRDGVDVAALGCSAPVPSRPPLLAGTQA